MGKRLSETGSPRRQGRYYRHERIGMPFDYSSCDFIRDYIKATEEALAETKTEGEFFYYMYKKFPDATLHLSNIMNAGFFKGGMDWSWKEEE